MLFRLLKLISVSFTRGKSRVDKRRRSRCLVVEFLAARYPLTAEGLTFSFNQVYDTSAIGGTISGSVLWGDGTSTPATVGASPAAGPLSIRIDYSMDAANFFSTQERKNALQFAANSIVSKFSDQLTAIQPTGVSSWTARFLNPATGAQDTRLNLSIAANEILVFAGGRNLAGNELGRGERGGFNASSPSQAFIDTVRTRGQTGAIASPATDFGPWGGTVVFSQSANWHFGLTTAGLDSNESDFVSVASHELLHMLGFGLANSWNAKVAGGFTGANSVAVSGRSPVPLNDASHWAIGTTYNGQPAAMTPVNLTGQRVLPTRLDLAGMQDVGWQLIAPQVQVSASHIYGDNGTFTAQLQLSGSILGTTSIPISVNITNVNPVLAARQSLSAIQGQSIAIPKIGQFTDAGFGANLATPPQTETFTYSIQWGDGTPVDSGPAIVEAIGSPGLDTRGYFDGVHSYAQMGSYTVTLTVTDDDGGSSQQQFTINVGAPPSLEISIDRASIAEDAGRNAATVTVRRTGFDLAQALNVALRSSDTTELQLPPSIVIPAGQSSASIAAEAIDDSLLDGTIRVLIDANVGAIASNSVAVDVLDREKIIVSLDRTTVGENAGAGAATMTVSRSNSDVGESLLVLLSSSDTSEASLPSSVLIAAGSSIATVGIDAIDDALFDGSQAVTLDASSTGYESASAILTVTDYQPLVLVLQSTTLNEEDPARRTTQAEVSLRSPAPAGGVTLQLTAEPSNQLIIPPSVFVPAGSLSAPFPVSAVDDFAPQGTRPVRVFANGNGVLGTSIELVITDSDPAYWTNPANRFDVNNNGAADPLDVLTIINEINLGGVRALNPNFDLGLPFVDVNANGLIDPLDVLAIINEINS